MAQFTGQRLSVNAEFWNRIAKREPFFAPTWETESFTHESSSRALIGFGLSGFQFQLECVQGEVDVPDECDHRTEQ